MYRYVPFLLLLFFLTINAQDEQDENSPITNPITSKTIAHNLPESESNDSNKTQWNIRDWDKSLKKTTDGAVGNTMLFMNDSPFLQRGVTTDTSKLTTEAYNTDPNASKAATGFNDNFRTKMTANVMANKSASIVQNPNENTLKCFIARDLPFRYRCEETNLVYGGSLLAKASNGKIVNMDGVSGKEALNMCKDNCKRSMECMEVESKKESRVALPEKSFIVDTDTPHVENYALTDSLGTIKQLSFELSLSDDDNSTQQIYMDMFYTNSKNKKTQLVQKVNTSLLRGTKNISLGVSAKEISFVFTKTDGDDTTNIELKNVFIDYEDGSKYVCSGLQDIAMLKGMDSFASRCPSGNTITFGEVEICMDGVDAGDNEDGTYSSRTQCNNICNISKNCNVEFGSFDSTIFEQFREGRLGRIAADGEFTSADVDAILGDVDCTNARINRTQVLNEVSFNADGLPSQTVLNGSLVTNAKRPRVSSANNLDYETIKKEEWKDNAYENMLKSGSYSSSTFGIGEETMSSFAYYMSLQEGAAYGDITATSKRELIWRLKPNALLYNDNNSYKLYTVVKVDVEKSEDTYSGERITRDQIWYIKTSATLDSFKPFVRARDYATSVITYKGAGNISPTLNYNNSATFRAETFVGDKWSGISKSSIAPYFTSITFVPDEFWYEFKIFNSFGEAYLNLPGIVRRSVSLQGGYTNYHYSGNFDGTGEGVVGYQVYAFFSSDSLTYKNLIDKINEIDNSNPKTNQVDNFGAKIYEMISAKNYDNFIKPDNKNTNSGAEIYQYGSADNHSLKVRIKPKAADIGKNGFVFIFVY